MIREHNTRTERWQRLCNSQVEIMAQFEDAVGRGRGGGGRGVREVCKHESSRGVPSRGEVLWRVAAPG